MATIDRVIDMQRQGMSDNDIVNSLRNEGINPKEIEDSLSQARIKMAISQDDPAQSGYQESYQETPQLATQDPYSQEQPTSQEQYEEAYPQQTEYPQQQGGYYQGQNQMSVETISEIVDRIISEKMKEINSKIKSVSEFKSRTENDILDLKDRLKRLESSTDNLQKAVVSKVGEVSQSTTMIHKDLDNLHGTMSKLMNPLIDNYNELKKQSEKHSEHKEHREHKK